MLWKNYSETKTKKTAAAILTLEKKMNTHEDVYQIDVKDDNDVLTRINDVIDDDDVSFQIDNVTDQNDASILINDVMDGNDI